MPQRGKNTARIDAAVFVEPLVFDGDERLPDVFRQRLECCIGADGYGDLFSVSVVQPHTGGGHCQLVAVESDVCGHAEIVQEHGEQNDEDDSERNARDFQCAFHRIQYARHAEKFAGCVRFC